MNLKRFRKALALLTCLLVAVLMSCAPETKPQSGEKDFKIYILQNILDDPAHGASLYESYEKSQTEIKALSLDRPLFVITAADIDTYDWKNQNILLTQAAARWIGDPRALFEKTFLVTLGEEKLYGGVILSIISARRLECPVMYADDPEQPQFTLEIRPRHELHKYSQFDPKLKAIVEIDAVYRFFRDAGKIK